MPRTIDHIVECHTLAVERRRSGKPVWDQTIDIGAILAEVREAYGDKPDNTALNATAKRIAALVRSKVPETWLDMSSPDYDRDLEEFVEEFDDIGLMDTDDGYTLLEHFNGWLDQFYDWADYKRIWTGGLGQTRSESARPALTPWRPR